METFFMTITWQVVVSLGIVLAFVFALLWLYRPKENLKQESKPVCRTTNSKEKQLGELQDILYKHLQTRIYLEKIDEGGNKYKEYNEANDQLYIDTLTSAINELKVK